MRYRWLLLLTLLVGSFGQQTTVSGDYSGMLGPLHIKLHLKTARGGVLQGTLDSVDQGAAGLACADLKIEGDKLSFTVPSVAGKWHGSISDKGSTLTGMWSQGQEIPLVFHRDQPFAAAAKPSPVDGIWLGALTAGATKLRIQLHVKSDQSGKEYCSLDSLDQQAMGLPCDNVRFEGSNFSFEVPVVHGHWSGTLTDGNNSLDGTWSQGRDLPLRFTRQATAIDLKPPEPPKYESALAPVSIDRLQTVLERDLEAALQTGALAPGTGGGVVAGVVQHGIRHIYVFGNAKENQIFEIGSITKTFTGLILAQMAAQKRVRLEEPVRDLLPTGTVPKSKGSDITLLDLATQHSGLPRMPDNFNPANPEDPYADYRPANLYQFLSAHGLDKPADAGFSYSNLGFGLLGQALANCAKESYAELLLTEVTEPLGLKDTAVALSPEQTARFATGHGPDHHPAHAWTFDALAGAGAIRSTAAGMLTYLEAQLHPKAIRPQRTPEDLDAVKTIAEAIEMTHQLRADALPGMKIGLAWLNRTQTGEYWHNGATGAFSSYAVFNPTADYAVVVLFNTTISPQGSFADALGEHIAARLTGKPAISLK